jgi:hypothetical protein
MITVIDGFVKTLSCRHPGQARNDKNDNSDVLRVHHHCSTTRDNIAKSRLKDGILHDPH